MPDRPQTIREAEEWLSRTLQVTTPSYSLVRDLLALVNEQQDDLDGGAMAYSEQGQEPLHRIRLAEAAESTVQALRESFETLVSACWNDFISPATDDCLDDEGVAFGTCALTFGMIRKARALLLASPQSQEGNR